MKGYKIVKFPNSVLRKKAKPVEYISSEQRKILDKMAKTMYEQEAVGVAAQQVGLTTKLAVVDARDRYGLIKLVNPTIIEKEGTQIATEGCLSLPGIAVDVPRAEKIKVKAKDERGQDVTFDLEGLVARVFQHEIDHLNGKVIIDYFNPLKKMYVLFKLHLANLFKKAK
jgi:peptide deformylase